MMTAALVKLDKQTIDEFRKDFYSRLMTLLEAVSYSRDKMSRRELEEIEDSLDRLERVMDLSLECVRNVLKSVQKQLEVTKNE